MLFNDSNRWRAYRCAAGIIDDIARLGGINHQFLVSACEGSYCMQFKAGKSLLRVKLQASAKTRRVEHTDTLLRYIYFGATSELNYFSYLFANIV